MRFLATVALLMVVFPFNLSAEEGKPAKFSGFLKYEKYHSIYHVNSDGTYIATHEILVKVLTEEGLKAANQAGFSYSESLEEAVVLSAYTLKKDGRRIDAPPLNIQERTAVAGGGPMFSDIKSKVIIFPDIAVDDRVGYSYKLIQKTPLFPGHFSLTEVFTKFAVYDDVRVEVSVPTNSLRLQVFVKGVQGGRVSDKDGRMQWVWTYQNTEIATPEVGSVNPIDYGPQIIVSSFQDYGAIGAAYDERAKPKAEVTDKIRKLADNLTEGVTAQREQARILYTWVAQNIRYAGNCIGIGSVVPHDAEMVLANRLGDCKDHTALLQALLAAKNIESIAVLVNSGSSFELPQVPSLGVLNHVISYLPSLDLYVDSSSEVTPFGLLPMSVSGKPVVHSANFAGIRRTPPTDYKANISRMKMVLKIQEDGSADGETQNEETGILAGGIKTAMAYIQPNMEDIVVRSILAGSGYTGTGSLIRTESRELTDRYTYGLKYHLKNAMNLPGPGAIHLAPILPSGIPIQAAIQDLNLPERTLNFGCFGGIATEEYTLHLPKNIKIITLPKDVHLSSSKVSYDSTYRRNDNTVSAIRKLEERIPGNLCTPDDDKEFRPLGRAILKDLKAQIIYGAMDDGEK
jgi:hypothetical protein